MLRRLIAAFAAAVLLAALGGTVATSQDATEKEVERYRAMLKDDPWSNPGNLDVDRGEGLRHAGLPFRRGPGGEVLVGIYGIRPLLYLKEDRSRLKGQECVPGPRREFYAHGAGFWVKQERVFYSAFIVKF